MNLLRLINLSLAHVYCSTTLSNMNELDLIDSSRKLVSISAISFIINLCLILQTSVKHPMSGTKRLSSPANLLGRLSINSVLGEVRKLCRLNASLGMPHGNTAKSMMKNSWNAIKSSVSKKKTMMKPKQDQLWLYFLAAFQKSTVYLELPFATLI
jgi:hypothetical protein